MTRAETLRQAKTATAARNEQALCAAGRRLLRAQELPSRVGLSSETIYRLRKRGQFPDPIQIGAKFVAWYEDEIDEWMAGRPRVRLAPPT